MPSLLNFYLIVGHLEKLTCIRYQLGGGEVLLGLDEIILKCKGADSFSHIQEAMACYQSGAYRSAIVTAYVAVCFDLFSKLTGLSDGGDAEAKLILDRFNKASIGIKSDQNIKILLEIERNLIKTFRDKFEYFSSEQYIDLERLREDRNRCAHPTFYGEGLPFTPSPELARMHIRSAVDHVISQPLKQGKAAIAAITARVTSSTFPTDKDHALEVLRHSEIASARAPLIRALIDDAMFGYIDKDHVYYNNDKVVPLLKASLDMHRVVASPQVTKNINKLARDSSEQSQIAAGNFTLTFPDAAEDLDDAARVVVRSWLPGKFERLAGRAVNIALDISWLRLHAVTLIPGLTKEQIAYVASAVVRPKRQLVEHVVNQYRSVHSFSDANTWYEKCVAEYVPHFGEDDVRNILDGINRGGDLLDSYTFPDFIKSVIEMGVVEKDRLIEIAQELGLANEITRVIARI